MSGEPQTVWVTFTNLLLAFATLGVLLALVVAVLLDLRRRPTRPTLRVVRGGGRTRLPLASTGARPVERRVSRA